MKLFIAIPAYNEAKTLGLLLGECVQNGYKNILVIDDGSRDDTSLIAEKCGALVVRHMINCGVGAATQTALEAARRLDTDLLLTMDADGQHSPADIDAMVSLMQDQKYDVVIGSRFMNRHNRIPLTRRFFNLVANWITFLLSGKKLSDTQSGMKLFSRKALDSINIRSDGFEFSSEIIREAAYHRLQIGEVPISVQYTDYSMSKGQNFATGLSTVFKLIVKSLMR